MYCQSGMLGSSKRHICTSLILYSTDNSFIQMYEIRLYINIHKHRTYRNDWWYTCYKWPCWWWWVICVLTMQKMGGSSSLALRISVVEEFSFKRMLYEKLLRICVGTYTLNFVNQMPFGIHRRVTRTMDLHFLYVMYFFEHIAHLFHCDGSNTSMR